MEPARVAAALQMHRLIILLQQHDLHAEQRRRYSGGQTGRAGSDH
jgi:hypothetical protein